MADHEAFNLECAVMAAVRFPEMRLNVIAAFCTRRKSHSFRDLERVLGPMISDLGEQPDDTYTSDSRWAEVVETASRVLAVMQQCDEGKHD